MADLIDRQKLLRKVAKLRAKDTMRYLNSDRIAAFGWTKGDIYEIIFDAPSVPQWIPVDKKLPKNQNSVLITDCGSYVDIGFYQDGAGWWYRDDASGRPDVSAWMPLPSPYGEEKELADDD